MQDSIVITDDAISGNLKEVEKYPLFGDVEANSPSHYLALSFESADADSIKTKVINGNTGEVDCTADKFCVYRIKNNINQKIEVKAIKGNETNTKIYSLTGLKLAGGS